MADVYIESPLDRIVDVHFAEPEPPPVPYEGTASFNWGGATFTIPGEEGPFDGTGAFNVTTTGNAIHLLEGSAFITIIAPPVGTSHTWQITVGVHAEVTTAVPAGTGELSVWVDVRDFSGAVYYEAGPALATSSTPGDMSSSSGPIAVPPGGLTIKLSFRAAGHPITLGFGRTFPNLCHLVVS